MGDHEEEPVSLVSEIVRRLEVMIHASLYARRRAEVDEAVVETARAFEDMRLCWAVAPILA